MTETAAVYNVGITRPQSKPSFDSQLDCLPPDVRSVAESLALRDMESGGERVSKKITKGQNLLGRQIETFMAEAPADELLRKHATTQDLINRWLELRGHSIWIGKCLRAGFGGGGGNPAMKAFKAGLLTQIEYEATMVIVDYNKALFDVLQVGWEELHEILKWMEGSPSSERELFLRILQQTYDHRFMKCVRGGKVTLQRGEKLAKFARDALREGLSSEDWLGEFSPQKSIWAKEICTENPDSWFLLSMRVCQEAAINNRPLKNKLRELLAKFDSLTHLLAQAYREEREPNPPRRFRSESWDKGQLRIGTKGGFKSVT